MKAGSVLQHVRACLPWATGAVLGMAAMPAQAIVSSQNPASWLGGGIDYLDGVGQLIVSRSDGNFGCSGSLIAGGQYVLTAAHCLSGDSGTLTTSSVALSFKGGSVTASATEFYTHGGWTGDTSAGNDIALIKLASAITSIDGYQFASGNVQGASVIIAGYGFVGTGASGFNANTFGTLRYGYNEYDASSLYYTQHAYSSSVYLYDFDSPAGSSSIFGSAGLGASEATIAPGDSGGATLVNVGGEWLLAGVHSFASCPSGYCPVDGRFGDIAGDTSVFAQSAWLQSYLPAAVPEAPSWAMLMAGAGLLGGIARRRNRTSARP
ncbi:trypsin-like serine protease [Uliginosibacterium sp. H3]|uniref:Trypsin-like serine protease n=1 Tax=Uliginosibacterium silvisoli TaxID=3114758 RepID=A0ABU6K281_9RHOO|nr:trypsin-like serine protease [Uliginosibacterium sp. H3]